MPRKVEASVRLKVPFHDVDTMQVVWHGHYLKYFEQARQVLAEKSTLDMYTYHETSGFTFPVIRSSIKHVYPLRLGDEFICTVILREAKVKIVMDYEVRLAADLRLCARGRTEQVALRLENFEMELMIPEDVQEALWAIR